MNPQEKLLLTIAQKLPKDKKEEMLKLFMKKYENSPNKDALIKEFKEMLEM